jgi:hypothetical protein
MFTVTFNTENEAFVDNFANEAFTILRNVADRVAKGDQSGAISDTNGAVVGRFAYHQDDDDRPTVI